MTTNQPAANQPDANQPAANGTVHPFPQHPFPQHPFATNPVELTPEERNARSALNWLAELQAARTQPGTPTPEPSPQTRQAIRRVLDELLASGRYPHINESYAEFLDATNAAVSALPTHAHRDNDDEDDNEDWDDLPRVSGPQEAARERLADAVHELAHHLVRADPDKLVLADANTPDGPCAIDDCSTENTVVYAFRVRQRRFRPQDEPTNLTDSASSHGQAEPIRSGERSDSNGQPADEFGHHTVPYFRRGRAWANSVLAATQTGITADITTHMTEADRLLGPLGNVTNPDDLRDFIAGAARQIDTHHGYTP